MKNFWANIGANLVAIICVVAAAFLAAKGVAGWGWFLFVGFCCAGSVMIKEK